MSTKADPRRLLLRVLFDIGKQGRYYGIFEWIKESDAAAAR